MGFSKMPGLHINSLEVFLNINLKLRSAFRTFAHYKPMKTS